MNRHISEDFVLDTKLNNVEIELFLKSIWGQNSPLAVVHKIKHKVFNQVHDSMYCAVKKNGKIVALAGLKFIDSKLIELGSLAVAKRYRGKGLTNQLFKWRDKILNKFLLKKFDLITYATLGSGVMNFIGSKMSKFGAGAYVMNVALGVVPINKSNMKGTLTNINLAVGYNKQYYTSTISIRTLNQRIYYEAVDSIQYSLLKKIYPLPKGKSKVTKSNICFKLDPIRMNICIVGSLSEQVNIDNNYYNQIQVPVLKSYNTLHRTLAEKYVVTGFSINNNILYCCYSNIKINDLLKVFTYLNSTRDAYFYKEWIKTVLSINRLTKIRSL